MKSAQFLLSICNQPRTSPCYSVIAVVHVVYDASSSHIDQGTLLTLLIQAFFQAKYIDISFYDG